MHELVNWERRSRTPYERLTVFFTSGTGNSYRAARWAAEKAESAGVKSEVVPIENARARAKFDPAPRDLVGIYNPTHAFTVPWHMLRFVLRMPRGKRASAFAVSTRAGTKFGRVFLPGIAGSGPFLIALILRLKGYRVRGATGLDMPSNWIAAHPGFKEENARAIETRHRPKADRFVQSVVSGGRQWLSGSNLWDFAWGVLLLPVSIAYSIGGRFVLAKIFFANEKCNACGVCEHDCPVGAVRLVGKKNPRPYWRYNCESCMRCMAFCPEKAIEASHPWMVLLFFLWSMPVSMVLFGLAADLVPGALVFDRPWVRGAIDFAFLYPAAFLSYYVFHLLVRWAPARALFSYTTPTRLYRRYHEPDTKPREIVVNKRLRRNHPSNRGEPR